MAQMYRRNEPRNFEILARLEHQSAKEVARDFPGLSEDNIWQISSRYRRWFKRIKVQGKIQYKSSTTPAKPPAAADGKSKLSGSVSNIPLQIVA